MSPLQAYLDCVQRVASQPDAKGNWRHSCQGRMHKRGDHSRGAYAKETETGSVLLWCAAGCTAEDMVHGAGLDLRDLFVKQAGRSKPLRVTANELLKLIENEAKIVRLAAYKSMYEGLSVDDLYRVDLAYERINSALEVASGY